MLESYPECSWRDDDWCEETECRYATETVMTTNSVNFEVEHKFYHFFCLDTNSIIFFGWTHILAILRLNTNSFIFVVEHKFYHF